MKAVFYASKFSGKLKFEKPELYHAFVSGLKPNIRQEITIKKYVPERSNQQNKYYWKVVVGEICDYTKQDKDSVHDALRMMFLKVEHESLPTVKSTKKLSTIEFNAYIEQCVMWAAEFLQIVIPDPYLTGYEF